ncbi:MAG TPA: DUF5684 domain-containing protein [Candidatus Saccharimonadales bacterium]|jgi:hypothetical protein|nr:DUF5684 domain-containing protein [Candidatus Saccharimonadales bacterium]
MNALFAHGSYDSYDYPVHTADDSTLSAVAILFMMFFVFITLVVTYVALALLLGRIFKKAGVESWKAWVPFYNNWILYELGDQKGYWAVVAIIPVANIVSGIFMIIAMYKIGLKLGKEGVFVLWAIFVPLVWYVWLAFDDSKWQKKSHKSITKTQEIE